jgi:hypothetical protein
MKKSTLVAEFSDDGRLLLVLYPGKSVILRAVIDAMLLTALWPSHVARLQRPVADNGFACTSAPSADHATLHRRNFVDNYRVRASSLGTTDMCDTLLSWSAIGADACARAPLLPWRRGENRMGGTHHG